MPIGGIIAREEDMIWGPGSHGSTYGGNPVAAASAIATLEVIEQENLLAQAEKTGAYIRQRLTEMMDRHPSIGDVRGRGLMIGLEFVENRESKTPCPGVRGWLTDYGFEEGVLLLPCGVSSMRITPPLNVSRELVDEGLALFERALTRAEARCADGCEKGMSCCRG